MINQTTAEQNSCSGLGLHSDLSLAAMDYWPTLQSGCFIVLCQQSTVLVDIKKHIVKNQADHGPLSR